MKKRFSYPILLIIVFFAASYAQAGNISGIVKENNKIQKGKKSASNKGKIN